MDLERQRMAMLERQLEEHEPDHTLRDEVSKLKEKLGAAKERVKQLWSMSCEQIKMHDQSLSEKDAEIARRAHAPPYVTTSLSLTRICPVHAHQLGLSVEGKPSC